MCSKNMFFVIHTDIQQIGCQEFVISTKNEKKSSPGRKPQKYFIFVVYGRKPQK